MVISESNCSLNRPNIYVYAFQIASWDQKNDNDSLKNKKRISLQKFSGILKPYDKSEKSSEENVDKCNNEAFIADKWNIKFHLVWTEHVDNFNLLKCLKSQNYSGEY